MLTRNSPTQGFEHIEQYSYLVTTPVWSGVWRMYVRGDPHWW